MSYPSASSPVPASVSFDPGSSLRSSLAWAAGAGVVVVAAGVALVALGIIDIAQLVQAAREVSVATLAAVLVMSCVNYLLRGLRWHILTREVAPHVTLRESMLYFLAGFAFLLTPAKIGEVVRLWLLKSRHDVPYTRSLSLLLLDRVLDVVSLVLFAAIGLLGRSEHSAPLLAFLAALVLASALLSSRGFVVLAIKLAHRWSGRRWPGLMRFALQSYRSLRKVSRPGVLASALALSLSAWAAQITGAWMIFSALGHSLDVVTTTFVFSFTILAGSLPLFPGGLGGAEAAMVGLLVLVGMPSALAITATVLSRLATLWLALLVGFAIAPITLANGRDRSAPAPATLARAL